jgi:glycine/D-amino acid oxidase-like deaminating enzyme
VVSGLHHDDNAGMQPRQRSAAKRVGWSPAQTAPATVWADSLDPADRAVLDPGVPVDLDRRPDVLVVGGGVIGLATALFCRRAGLGRVLVIEARRLAAGASGGAGGALAPDLHQLTDPPAFMRLARASLTLYRDLDQEWDGALKLRWAPRLILLPDGPPPWLQPWPGVQLLEADQVAKLEPDLAPVPAALLTSDQAQVNPLRLATVLARRAGSVATGIAMTSLQITGGRVLRVRTTAGDLHPGTVVLATGLAPEPWVRLPQRLVKGHLLATEPGRFHLRYGVHGPGGGIGPLAGGGLLAGGTRDEGDQSPQVRPEVVASIRRRLGALLPAAQDARLTHQWCCFRPATADGQPVIDHVPGLDNTWVSAGHNGTGILLAPATGQALAGWIATGKPPAEISSFTLSRFAQT